MRYTERLSILVLALMVVGCAPIPVSPYSPDYVLLEQLKSQSIEKISVAKVQPTSRWASVNHIYLRLSPLVVRNQEGTFASYLETAIKSDLKEVGVFDPDSNVQLIVTIIKNDIDVSGVSNGSGNLMVNLTITRNEIVILEKIYSSYIQFPISIFGLLATAEGRDQYTNLVRQLLKSIYSDTEFLGGVKK
jgi:hypothetical protein